MISKISQSFIKDFREYQAGGECGLIIQEKYVNDRLFEDDEPGAKEEGSYFEFMLSGALPKSGKVPKPVMMADGKKPMAQYRKAQVSAELIRVYLDRMGLKIVHIGPKWHKGRYVGTLDLVCQATRRLEFPNGLVIEEGEMIVIDLKYSGLIGPKSNDWRNKFGWQWSNRQKEYHGTQAIHYHFISGGLKFFFLVTQSSQAEGEDPFVAMFYIPVTQDMIDKHLDEGNRLFDRFEVLVKAEIPFVARPSLNKCKKCPLREECSFKYEYPVPEIIDLTPICNYDSN